MNLTEFLAARLDEDETAAKAAAEPADYERHLAPEWTSLIGPAGDGWVLDSADPDYAITTDTLSEIVTHIARHDPARVLREVDTKRKILALHYPIIEDYKDGDGIDRSSYECAECQPPGTPDNWPCPTVRALAAVWSDHPDYNPDWSR